MPRVQPDEPPPTGPPSGAGGVVRALRGLVIASVVAPLILLALAGVESRRLALRNAEQRLDRLALVLADHLRSRIQAVESALNRVADRLEGRSWDEITGSREPQRFLVRIVGDGRQVRAIGLADPTGRVVLSSQDFPAPEVSVADRDYFLALREEGRAFVVGQPIVGRTTSENLVPVAQRLTGADGAFAGAIVSSIAVDELVAFFRSLEPQVESSITIARTDGAVLLREPPVTTGAEMLSPQSGFMRTTAAMPAGGLYRTVSELDRIDRLHVIRPVGGYPIHVSYGQPMRAILAEWRRTVQGYAILTVMAIAALFSVSWLALRRVHSERAMLARYQAEAERAAAAEERLRQAQKLEAVGQLTGGIAHDFNNLLQVIASNLQLIAPELAAKPNSAQRLRQAQAGVERGAQLTRQLLAYARRQPLQPKVVNLASVLRGMEDLLRRTLGGGIEVETVVGEGLWNTLVDRGQLESAVLNLAVNARDAMSGQGRLTLEARNRTLPAGDPFAMGIEPGEYVALAVSDTGPGMPLDVLEHAFEPFFTTKPEGQGTGLGLSMVYGFVKQSHGHAEIRSEPGRGTTVLLLLPRARGEEQAAEPGLEEVVSGGSETVLVVEDNAAVREAAVATLESLGYRVRAAEDGQAALRVLERGPAVDLLFTDVVMPGPVSARELALRARQRWPRLAVLFTSGYVQGAGVAKNLPPDALLLPKPYERDELARQIRTALRQRPPPPAPPPRLRILLVEDEALVRLATRDMLERLGHKVIEAAHAEEALVRAGEGEIDLLLTDMGLPGMTGDRLATALRSTRPDLPVIFATGRDARSMPTDPRTTILSKPYSDRALAEALRRVAGPPAQ